MANTYEHIKKLGFGLMRLPMDENEVDIPHTQQMVDKFIAAGFTYFDTAYVYIDEKSEGIAKQVLVDKYPRESFQLATKLPVWLAKNEEEARQLFYTSLERTGAGYFDFYLLHSITAGSAVKYDEYNLWDFLKELKEKGLVKNAGFSFHDNAELLDKLLTQHPEVDFVQLQINYMDWESDVIQSRKCYEVARKHNKSVIVMEPVKGGSLATLPAELTQPLTDYNSEDSVASWALRYSASLDGIITVLSGMSNNEQMEDNLKTFTNFKPITEAELCPINETVANIKACNTIPCTSCGYCVKDCPANIAIPDMFKAVNNVMVYKNYDGARGTYAWVTKAGGKPGDCVECGQCEDICPQHIAIIEELKRVETTIKL